MTFVYVDVTIGIEIDNFNDMSEEDQEHAVYNAVGSIDINTEGTITNWESIDE